MKNASTDASREILFRMANDRIYNMAWGLEMEEGSFLCECDRPACSERIVLSGSEYVRFRDRGERVYAPGHGSHRR